MQKPAELQPITADWTWLPKRYASLGEELKHLRDHKQAKGKQWVHVEQWVLFSCSWGCILMLIGAMLSTFYLGSGKFVCSSLGNRCCDWCTPHLVVFMIGRTHWPHVRWHSSRGANSSISSSFFPVTLCLLLQGVSVALRHIPICRALVCSLRLP
jgi:hypothetical protein